MHRPDAASLVPGWRVAGPAAVAVCAEATAWALAVVPGTLSPAWYGVPRLLAAVHLLTLGTLALSITGFGWQLVPVVTAAPPPRAWPTVARAVNALLIAGIALLCAGMLAPAPGGLAAGGAGLVVVALLVRSIAVLAALLPARGRPGVRTWLIAAELSLWGGLGVGLVLLAERLGLQTGIVLSPIAGIGWHASLLLLGWVGGWIGGLAAVLLPMFAVAPTPRAAPMLGAATLWFGGLAVGSPLAWSLGAASLVATLLWVLSRRVARATPTGLGAAVVGLLALGGVGGLSLGGRSLDSVAVALVLFALPVLRGVALRIGPFLIWSHHLAAHLRRAPPVHQLVPVRPALVAAGMSLGAGGLVVAGLATHHYDLARLGAGLALCGTLSHGLVLGAALWRATRARSRLEALPGMEMKQP